ncbi:MAG: hypothetical protein OSB41_13215 [Kiritimatiellae bacterium]|nr:hypothetical protein [Kiritimatiellia bacterium]
MKKLLTVLTAVGVLAGVALAEEVTSVNIVGYKKHTFESGKLHLVSSQFQSIDGSPVNAETLIGDQLPYGSEIFSWNAKKVGGPGYESSERVLVFPVVDGWGEDLKLDGTKGFWVSPGGPTGMTYEVAFLGEVPLMDVVTNVIAGTITMTAYPYTADIAFTNTQLFAQSEEGDQMFIWDPDTQYSSYEYVVVFPILDGWGAAAEALVLTQGTGIWYDRASSNDLQIVDIRPYLN